MVAATKSPDFNLEAFMDQEASNLHTPPKDVHYVQEGTSALEEAESAEKAEFEPQSRSGKKEGPAQEGGDDDASGSANQDVIVPI